MQELTAEESAKNKEMFEAENNRRYQVVEAEQQLPPARQPGQPTYASEKDAERAALRGLKWLKKHPNAKVGDVPGHIREKLAVARHMMGIGA